MDVKPYARVLEVYNKIMRVDPRFLKGEGTEVFTGNELLMKGALEAEGGTHLLTGYPGSPIAGFFDAMEVVAPVAQGKGHPRLHCQ